MLPTRRSKSVIVLSATQPFCHRTFRHFRRRGCVRRSHAHVRDENLPHRTGAGSTRPKRSGPRAASAARERNTVSAMAVERMVFAAFDAESRRLAEVVDGLEEASFARPGPRAPGGA